MDQLNAAREVRNGLTNPRRLCEQLGWTKGAKRQAKGVTICCPAHGERTPSCSVTLGPDGTIRVHCFGCGWSGDALAAIALAHGLSTKGEDFREVLAIGAELGGQLALADEIRKGQPRTDRKPLPPPEPEPERDYPDAAEVRALWDGAAPVNEDALAVRMLLKRRVDFVLLANLGLARVIRPTQLLPRWARHKGRTWRETGHTLILPSFDVHGALRSVRSWRVTEGDTPKRLPPSGCRSSELVQANRLAVQMLRRQACPLRLWVMEGEPDFLTTATTFGQTDAVVGIGSGGWTEKFAARVPKRTHVYVSTHADEAGDRYADHVIETLGENRPVWRWSPAA